LAPAADPLYDPAGSQPVDIGVAWAPLHLSWRPPAWALTGLG